MKCSIEGCESLPERNGICSSHNRSARKAESDALKPRKFYTIPKQSEKMKGELKTYNKLRKAYLAKYPKCQIMLLGCEGVAIEIHHTGSRGENLNKVGTWKSTCRHCHQLLHDKLSAKEARDKGLKI